MSGSRSGLVIYIVDDDDSVRNGLSRLMRASGMAVQAFASPEKFLDAVSGASRGCVLLDMTMLHMTGLDVQAKLKEKGVHMPVIAVSARESDEVRAAARALGARFFLHKPVDDQALLDAIAWVSENAHGGDSREEPSSIRGERPCDD